MTELEILTSELLDNLVGRYHSEDAIAVYRYITKNTHNTVKVSDRVNAYTMTYDFVHYYLKNICLALGYTHRIVDFRCDEETLSIIESIFTICHTTDEKAYVFTVFNQRNGRDMNERLVGLKSRIRNKFIDEVLQGLG